MADLRFRKVFASNPSARFDSDELLKIAKEVVFICEVPMFDNRCGPEFYSRYDARVARVLKDFDPDLDAIVFYGDPFIFAMMVMFLSTITDRVNIARWSTHSDCYQVREINEANMELA